MGEEQKLQNNTDGNGDISKYNFMYYVQLIYRWRKFLTLHLTLVAIGAVIITLIIPKTFTSSATVLPESSQNVANMILPQKMTEGLGGAIGALTGSASNQTNTIMAILKSRELAVTVIDEFDLMERFEVDKLEEAIEEYREMIFVTIDDEQMIQLSVNAKTNFFNFQDNVDETRHFVFELAEFITSELDRNFTRLNAEKAKFERILVEKRFLENQEDLRKAEQEILEFSQKNSMISLPKQVEAAVETAAMLEAEIIANQIELATLTQTMSSSRPEVRQKQITVEQAEKKLSEIKLFGSSQDSLRLLPSFHAAPELLMEYVRLQRERSVQNILYEFLIQQYEQLKIQEARQSPSLQFIDRPAVPTKRTSPVRSLLAILLFSIGFIAGMAYLIGYELYQSKYKQLLADSIQQAKSG